MPKYIFNKIWSCIQVVECFFIDTLGAFSHLNRGVVVFPEHLEELSVVGDLRVEVDLNRLSVVALSGKYWSNFNDGFYD